MTPEFKNVYENMFSNIQEKVLNSKKRQSLTKRFNHHQNQSHGMPSFDEDHVLNAYKGMNKFFCLWLEKVLIYYIYIYILLLLLLLLLLLYIFI